jgi:DNA-binding protein HU-beta
MTKSEMIAEIAEKTGLSKTDAEKALVATFEIITEKLSKQEKILVPDFGGFSSKVRAERKGRNPATGEEIIIPQTVVASFKPATQLKETINK